MTATKQRAEVVFVGVTTDQYRPGKKLTKSLFRQVVLDLGPLDSSTKAEILGWVNYWPSSLKHLFSNENNKSVGWFTRTNNDQWLHVLWRNSDGQLRRFFLPNPTPSKGEQIQEIDPHIKQLWDTTIAKGQLYLAGM